MKKVLILLLWLLPSCSVVIFAQTQRIAGTVVVGDGQPAVGAAIVVKGTNIGAVTNVDGKFVIAEAPASAQRLVVYHVGMERKEVDVAPNVYIQLQPVEQGFSWNVKAGVSLFSYRRPDGLDERTGFSVGAGVEYNFSRHWAIQSGLMITSKGATAEYEGYSPLSSSTDPISYKAKISPIYLDIPILAAFKIDISNHVKFAINIGPYLSVGMGGKYELTNTGGHKNESHNPFKSYSSTAEMKDKDALLKRFDIGVQGGIGFEIWKHYLINASFQHTIQCTSTECISGTCRFHGIHPVSCLFYTHTLIVCTASIFTHCKENKRDMILLLQILDSFIIIFFPGHKLNLIIGNLQYITISEPIFHHLLCFIQRLPQRWSEIRIQ